MYGIICEIFNDEKRAAYGKHRYLVTFLMKLIFSKHLPTYEIDLSYKFRNSQDAELEPTGSHSNDTLKQVAGSAESQNDEGWTKLGINEVFSLSILTSEMRSCLSKSIFAPGLRLTDDFVVIRFTKKCSKRDIINSLQKSSSHDYESIDRLKYIPVNEAKIKFSEPRLISIDGEPTKAQEVHVKVLPQHANFIGTIFAFSDKEKQVRTDFKFV